MTERMLRVRKLPVEVHAVLCSEMLKWSALPDGITRSLYDESLWIETLEGIMRANPGDWIVRGIKGEYYPCKPDIFAANFEVIRPGGEE